MEILGVDFSGAKSDSNTWVAQGQLDGQGLVLESCRPVSRSQLTCLLKALTSGAVASLDFPFSVPLDFARFWRPEARAMPDLWSAAAAMNLEEFMSLRDAYVARRGETKRLCDSYHPECYSCLHKVNPNMVPMTFYGMKMLAGLWAEGCEVPPLALQDMGRGVLLGAMPGAALRALGLPYKGFKNGARAGLLRRQILQELPRRSAISMPNLGEFQDPCLGSHDCLDAVVAAVIAALWCTNLDLFRHPEHAAPPFYCSNRGLAVCPRVLLSSLWVETAHHRPTRRANAGTKDKCQPQGLPTTPVCDPQLPDAPQSVKLCCD